MGVPVGPSDLQWGSSLWDDLAPGRAGNTGDPIKRRLAIKNHAFDDTPPQEKIFVSATERLGTAKWFATHGKDPSGVVVSIDTLRTPANQDIFQSTFVPGEMEWLFFWDISEGNGDIIKIEWQGK